MSVIDVGFLCRNGRLRLNFIMPLLMAELLMLTSPVSARSHLRGQNATLKCNYESVDTRSSGVPKHTTFWEKLSVGGDEITVASFVNGIAKVTDNGPLGDRAEFEPPVLYIRELKVTDSGTYRCKVIQVTGTSVSNLVELEVNAVPKVEVQVEESPKVDDFGKYVAATCRASGGKPPATIRWIDTQSRNLLESEDMEERLDDGSFNVRSRLLLQPGLLGRQPNSTEPVTERDWRKNFTCAVYHDYLDYQQEAVTVPIDLLYPPIVTISVKSNKLTCHALGNPSPSIIWKRPDGSTEVGRDYIFVDQLTPKASSGRYVCLAQSTVGPRAVSTINVPKSEDLPTLLVSTLRYNASLPQKAKNYEMECRADLENMEREAVEHAFFDWTKNGKSIVEKLSRYSIEPSTVEVSAETVLIKSVLRILQVSRDHDEGLFKCRLSLPTPGTGYVRAVERAINVKVDYPPDRVMTVVHPETTVRERADVRLSCSAVSSPPSSYLWYFNGKVRSTRPQFLLRNISRKEAGTYKCVAYNYVPGSAFREVRLVVNYPPGRVHIIRTSSSLSCSTEGGSLPPPLYSWLLPNGTLTGGNKSVLDIPSLDVSSTKSYTCVVANGLETSNASFQLAASRSAGIGHLTIEEFIVTIVMSVLLLLIIVALIVFLTKKREIGRKASVTKARKDTNGSTLLEYTEPPYGGSPVSMSVPRNMFGDSCLAGGGGSPGENDGKSYFNSDTLRVKKNSYEASSTAAGNNTVMSPHTVGKPALVNYVAIASKSNLHSREEGEKEPPSRYRSLEVLEGSGVEILENSSLSSVRGKESTLPRANAKAPLKLSTFSQPPDLYSRLQGQRNYNTTRNPAREKVKHAALTRALSENLRPALEESAKPAKSDHTAHSNSPKIGTGVDGFQPPLYSASDRARVASPRPAISTPVPLAQSQSLQKSDKETGYCSDSSAASSSIGKPSFDYQHVTSASHIGGCTNKAYPGFRQHAINTDTYNFHPDMDFRPSPLPSRCPSVDPYNTDCTPRMVDIPTRNYLYDPYADARLGIAHAGPKTSVHTTPTTVGSPYDSGAESKSSNATTATSAGRRMQSLTLV